MLLLTDAQVRKAIAEHIVEVAPYPAKVDNSGRYAAVVVNPPRRMPIWFYIQPGRTTEDGKRLKDGITISVHFDKVYNAKLHNKYMAEGKRIAEDALCSFASALLDINIGGYEVDEEEDDTDEDAEDEEREWLDR